MSHPRKTELALFAGGELGLWARWRVTRHVGSCEECSHEVRRFNVDRERLIQACLEQPSQVDWNRLAAEMKANIRVGLDAGRCVGPVEEGPKWATWRKAMALASILVVVVAGWWLQPREPVASSSLPAEGVVLEATATGIELKNNTGIFSLQHPDAERVTFSVSARGALRADYVDSETGYVTINNVYAQ